MSEVWSLEGKRVLLTGGNSGIGLATARELCRRGARVVLTARESGRGERAVQSIRDGVPAAEVSFRLLDLSRRESILSLAAGVNEDFERLDLLIHNAGLILSERREAAEYPDIKILAISGGYRKLTPEAALDAAREIGADAVLAKPFQLDEMCDFVTGMLAGKD